MGGCDFRSTYVEPTARYLYRHGDYFDTRDEEMTFRRRSDDEASTRLLEDVRDTLSSEYVYRLVQKSYKSDSVSEVSVDHIAYWRDDDESLMTVPKPWTNKDAYLVGTGANYRITLAPADNGHGVDDRYPAIATLGATKVTHQRPTFETSRFAVSQILNPQTEAAINWDEVWADLGVTPDDLSLG